MEGTIKPPAPLSNTGDMAQNWTRWKKDFLIFMELSNYNDKSQDIKAYLLRNYIGEYGQSIIEKIVFENAADRDDMNKLLVKLDGHFTPINEVMARFLFFSRFKQQKESIEDYISDLKKKAEICNFGKLTNSLIRDQIIAHIGDKALRKKLFEVKNLDLSKLVLMYIEHYASITQKSQVPSESTKQNDTSHKCWKCNKKHPPRKCPASNFKCANCGDLHHFTQCCKKNNLSKTETTETKMYNPNKNVYRSNTNLRAGNIQHGNTTTTEALLPSAPPLVDYGYKLYPNLYNVHSNAKYAK
ncbi:uncharacterized protein LOC100883608 isoform X2 [Megachile rotundata]|uniref:uncharacterized protein LOC100883608 isoform X2 n=1 Tax=Megachile rotundata TaxID=143995 RepID=UPI000614AF70|nr:PREDICTED: uncharacterized protein LOC100883608 isoform X1 [Megachile rotundata]